MSKSITNKTRGALKVPLPQGRALRLGPGQSGGLSPYDADHPPLKKLVEAGKIEIVDDADNEAVPAHGRRGSSPFKH